MLLGEAGIGKTRLLIEQRSQASGSVTWLEGHCVSYGTEIVYGPFIQILRNWIGAEDGEASLAVGRSCTPSSACCRPAQIPDVLPLSRDCSR